MVNETIVVTANLKLYYDNLCDVLYYMIPSRTFIYNTTILFICRFNI